MKKTWREFKEIYGFFWCEKTWFQPSIMDACVFPFYTKKSCSFQSHHRPYWYTLFVMKVLLFFLSSSLKHATNRHRNDYDEVLTISAYFMVEPLNRWGAPWDVLRKVGVERGEKKSEIKLNWSPGSFEITLNSDDRPEWRWFFHLIGTVYTSSLFSGQQIEIT